MCDDAGELDLGACDGNLEGARLQSLREMPESLTSVPSPDRRLGVG